MFDALAEYWIYGVVALVVVVAAILLLARRGGRKIDIAAEQDREAVRRTLERRDAYGVPRDERGRPPMFMPQPKSPLPRHNLLMIKGMGFEFASRLDAVNVTRFEQIAAWTEIEQAGVADLLGEKVERIKNDRWLEQAALLAAERYDEYEAKFGRIPEVEMNRFK